MQSQLLVSETFPSAPLLPQKVDRWDIYLLRETGSYPAEELTHIVCALDITLD